MKILVTAFDPFGGEKINPSMEVLQGLKIEGFELEKIIIPTSFSRSFAYIMDKIKDNSYDYLICLGQAGGRAHISLERIGVNIMNGRIADNDGNKPHEEKIDQNGPDGIFSTLPILDMQEAVKDLSIPVMISNSAGTFVCNSVLYNSLNYIKNNGLKTRAGFIHMPYLPSQTLDKPNQPSMELDTIIKAVEACIRKLI